MWSIIVGIMSFILVIGHLLVIVFLQSMTKDQNFHEKHQLAFNYQLQLGLAKLGRQPLPTNWTPNPQRNSLVYVVIAILTVTLFLPYWWYVIISDFNAHVEKQAQFEDQLIRSIR